MGYEPLLVNRCSDFEHRTPKSSQLAFLARSALVALDFALQKIASVGEAPDDSDKPFQVIVGGRFEEVVGDLTEIGKVFLGRKERHGLWMFSGLWCSLNLIAEGLAGNCASDFWQNPRGSVLPHGEFGA